MFLKHNPGIERYFFSKFRVPSSGSGFWVEGFGLLCGTGCVPLGELVGCGKGEFVNWLIGQLVNWLIGQLVNSSIGQLVKWFRVVCGCLLLGACCLLLVAC